MKKNDYGSINKDLFRDIYKINFDVTHEETINLDVLIVHNFHENETQNEIIINQLKTVIKNYKKNSNTYFKLFIFNKERICQFDDEKKLILIYK